MAAQGLRDRQGAGTATGLSFEEELSMQEEIFEARREELLAAHPDMLIAVCAGEVFVGSTDVEAIAGAEAAHPDRPIFLCGSNPAFEDSNGASQHAGTGHPSGKPVEKPVGDAAFEEDLARQEEIFEARREELLAAHPDMLIAVCAGEVFVGSTDVEAIARAEAAHPDRPIFLSGSEVFCWCA